MKAVEAHLRDKQKEFDQAKAELIAKKKHAIERAKVIHEQEMTDLVEETVNSIVRKFL